MAKANKWFLFIAVLIVLVGLLGLFHDDKDREVFDSREQLISYLADKQDKYIKRAAYGDTNVDFHYIPSVLLDSVGDYICFKVAISQDGKEILSQLAYGHYSTLVTVLSFRMSEYMYIRADDEIIYPDMVHFSPTYGLSDSNDLIVVFDRTSFKKINEDTFEFVLEDFGLVPHRLVAHFDASVIQYSPVIKNL